MRSIAKLLFALALLGAVTLAPSPAEAGEDPICATEVSCDIENQWGSPLAEDEVNDIETDENGCLCQWDCQYEDGFQTRHFEQCDGFED